MNPFFLEYLRTFTKRAMLHKVADEDTTLHPIIPTIPFNEWDKNPVQRPAAVQTGAHAGEDPHQAEVDRFTGAGAVPASQSGIVNWRNRPPANKQLRKKNRDEDLLKLYLESQPIITAAIEEIGLPMIGVEGFESDDCIGWLVRQQRHRYQAIYAASNDSDLFQLFWCPWFKVLKTDIKDCVDYWRIANGPLGMSPDEFMLSSALQGTHNDIEGIPGVGPVTAYKAVKNAGEMRKLRERWGEVIDRNLSLIKLPHPEFPHISLPRAAASFDARSLYRFCSRFDIQVTKSMIDSFDQICHE